MEQSVEVKSAKEEAAIRRTRRTAKRIQKWDILKAFLIFCVVLGHIADSYTDTFLEMKKLYFFIYIYHMPLFIFVSGLFAKKTINRNRIDKIIGYIVLYLAMKAAFFAYTVIYYHNYNLTILTEKTVPWFMLALPIFMGITMILKRVAPRYVLVASIFLACMAGYEVEIGDFLALSRVIVYYPFYYLGYVMNRDAIEELCRRKLLKVLAILIIACAAFIVIRYGEEIYWLRPLITGRNSFYELDKYPLWGWILRLGYYVISFLVCGAVVVIMPQQTPLGLIGKIGQQTLGVFVLHAFVLAITMNQWKFKYTLVKLPPFFGIWNVLWFALLIVLVLSIPVFTMLISRIMNVPLRPVTRKKADS